MLMLLAAAAPVHAEPTAVHWRDVVVEQVPPVYPLNTQAEKTEAVCTMSVTLSAAGEPTSVEPADAACPEVLTRSVQRAIRQWEFAPYEENGEPVAVTFLTRHRFELAQQEWWRDGARPEDFSWPPERLRSDADPYTPNSTDAIPTFRDPAWIPTSVWWRANILTMQCMGTLYVDAGGQVYGAVVEDLSLIHI